MHVHHKKCPGSQGETMKQKKKLSHRYDEKERKEGAYFFI